MGQVDRNENILIPVPFTFDFYFFKFFLHCFKLKLIYFIENKKIMIFYKLFIKKLNYYYLY